MICPACQGVGKAADDTLCDHCRGSGAAPGRYSCVMVNDATGVTSRWQLTISPMPADRVGLALPAEKILEDSARFLGVTVEELCSRSRTRSLVTARRATAYALRELTDLSYPGIARLLGGRDHTTIIHAVDVVQDAIARNTPLAETACQLVNHLRTRRATATERTTPNT